MNKIVSIGILSLTFAAGALADVSITDSATMQNSWKARKLAKEQGSRPEGLTATPEATGSQQLADSLGMKYFFNTNITFSTSSSASGAASEASYTGPVNATTSLGGTVSTALNDAFDGYNSICISTTGATGPCATGNAAYTIYNKRGPATTELSGRQIVYPAQTIGSLSVSRKVFVPTNDQFARWLEIVKNNGASPQTFNLITCNNLGSDANTVVVSSSDGDATAEVTDTWVSSFQNYSGTTSSDPRLAHILQGPGAIAPVSVINFVNGDDNPWWTHTITLQPGATAIVMHFVTGEPSKAAAAAKAAELVLLPANATQGMTPVELGQVVNFAISTEIIPALSPWALACLSLLLVSVAFVALRIRG
jgi:hypothetical protein